MRAVRPLRWLSLAPLAGALAGCASQGLAALGDTSRSLGPPKSHANLTIFPVYGTAAKRVAEYITLDEGLRAGTVKVTEHGHGGSVNAVDVVNKSGKPLFLLGGEVILGGQQDRCLGESTIVPPSSKKQKVTVFCVEHGRWTGTANFDRSAGSVSGKDVRLHAADGAFMAGMPDTRGRQAASVAQDKVWNGVAEKARWYSAQTPSGTYAAVIAAPGGNAEKAVGPYLSTLKSAFSGDRRVIGAVAVVNGQPVAADVFGDPVLFARLWPKLLKSYAMDAFEARTARPAAKPDAKAARSFLMDKDSGVKAERRRTLAGENVRAESRESVQYQTKAQATGGFAGATVHEGKLRK